MNLIKKHICESRTLTEIFPPSSKKVWIYSIVVLLGAIAFGVITWRLVEIYKPENNVTSLMLSYITGYVSLWLLCRFYLNRVGYYDTPWHFCYEQEDVDLNNYTMNGIGTMMKGSFGQVGGFFRSYQFFCWFSVPLIPLKCIVKSHDESDGDTTTFNVVGKSRWHILEVVVLMGRFWAFLFAGIFIFNLFQ